MVIALGTVGGFVLGALLAFLFVTRFRRLRLDIHVELEESIRPNDDGK